MQQHEETLAERGKPPGQSLDRQAALATRSSDSRSDKFFGKNAVDYLGLRDGATRQYLLNFRADHAMTFCGKATLFGWTRSHRASSKLVQIWQPVHGAMIIRLHFFRSMAGRPHLSPIDFRCQVRYLGQIPVNRRSTTMGRGGS